MAPARSPRSSARGQRDARALRNGSSIAELAEAQGIDSADVVDAIVARAEERLDTAVENGRIDDTQAAEMLTRPPSGPRTSSTARSSSVGRGRLS